MRAQIPLSAVLLPLLATASPLDRRAGGPIAKPIPKACTVVNPLPHASCGTANVDGWMPSPDFKKQHLVYEAYFESFRTQEQDAKMCKQQCYGYGLPGDCKSSFIGYNVPTPPGYLGTAGGVLETGCLLFGDYLSPLDFVKAPPGQYQNATAADIYCPAS